MLTEYPEILTSRDICDILAISKDLLYKLIMTGELHAFKVGKKKYRFRKDKLIDYLNAR